MSLITCPECSQKVSEQAQHCPHCGFPIQQYLADRQRAANQPHTPADPQPDSAAHTPAPGKLKETILSILGAIFILGVAGYFIVPYFTETTPRDHEVIMPGDSLNTDYDESTLPDPSLMQEARPVQRPADSIVTSAPAATPRDSVSSQPAPAAKSDTVL